MDEIDVHAFINKLGIKLPPKSEFEELGNTTALYYENDQFWQLNFERGMLLYAFISKYKPQNILEFGTGAGYSTLSMARALHDNDIDGKIFTIDVMSMDTQHTRPVCFRSGKPQLQTIAISDIWEKVAPRDWVEKITLLNGYSREVFDLHNFPKIDFAYVDGAHFYQAVKHDFYSFLSVAAEKFGVLFDDYAIREHYGVKKLLDELDSEFDITLIDTDLNRDLMKLNAVKDEPYGMCWLDFYNSQKLSEISFFKELSNFISEYRKIEKRIKRREYVKKHLPFLKNIKHMVWK